MRCLTDRSCASVSVRCSASSFESWSEPAMSGADRSWARACSSIEWASARYLTSWSLSEVVTVPPSRCGEGGTRGRLRSKRQETACTAANGSTKRSAMPTTTTMSSDAHTPSFLIVSNHGQALIAIAENPDVRLRKIAERLGITERATQSIVNDLVDAGYVERTRVGRRNVYTVHPDQPFPHPALQQNPVRSLLAGLVAWKDDEADEIEELEQAAEPDDALDRLTGLAAMLLSAPVSFIGLVDGDVEVIASATGLPGDVTRREVPLEETLCQYVVSGRAPMVVVDTAEDALLASHPGVAQHGLRAYAGLPLL